MKVGQVQTVEEMRAHVRLLMLIETSAGRAHAEIRRMAQSARRSIGQQARYHMQALIERRKG